MQLLTCFGAVRDAQVLYINGVPFTLREVCALCASCLPN